MPWMPAAACCATTSGGRKTKTPRGATSPSTPCTTTRKPRWWLTSTRASRTHKKRVLRMIGDPATRYREDPVRIIRAVRFAAKLSPLGFQLSTAKTAKPLVQPASRCCTMCRKAACSTKCSSCCKPATPLPPLSNCESLGLAKGIYPLLDVVVERAATPFVQAALHGHRPPRGRRQSPWRPASCWPACCGKTCSKGWEQRLNAGAHALPALQDAIDEVFDAAHWRCLGPRQAGRRHARDLGHAAAL